MNLRGFQAPGGHIVFSPERNFAPTRKMNLKGEFTRDISMVRNLVLSVFKIFE